MTSQLRYDSSNRFISRRLISGVSFMSISFIDFKKRRGGGVFDAPLTVQGRPKKPSLNRVNQLAYLHFHEVVPINYDAVPQAKL